MEKHKCKLCSRNFTNGRALGGHMRSHMMNLCVPPKKKQHQENINDQQLSEEIESVPFSSSSEDGEINEEKGWLLSYEFSENPKRNSRLINPDQLSFAAEAANSVVLQDRESETESLKNPVCGRSKRVRRSRVSDTHQFSGYNMKESHVKKPKSGKEGQSPIESPVVDHEPVSSISDTTPEEDVAHCLMMLSRDKWMRGNQNREEDEYDQGGEGEEEDAEAEEAAEEEQEQQESEKEEKEKTKDGRRHYHDSGALKVTKSRTRAKYRCETCNKVFRSYQALGGHKASHKRIKISNSTEETAAAATMAETVNAGAFCTFNVEEKIHECPICFRVFSSGQALGGHKRSHCIAAGTASIPAAKPFSRFGVTLIDLNLPAPIDEDDLSQIELSAVSDAEFVNHIKQ